MERVRGKKTVSEVERGRAGVMESARERDRLFEGLHRGGLIRMKKK